ncbi:MAG: carboxypeptidase regulatory-like domain-containing protein [Planctomycetes bacterium]|nr:carboxypeptidase regulatory-like domain-containing protein [Planctomycetota bacterium]
MDSPSSSKQTPRVSPYRDTRRFAAVAGVAILILILLAWVELPGSHGKSLLEHIGTSSRTPNASAEATDKRGEETPPSPASRAQAPDASELYIYGKVVDPAGRAIAGARVATYPEFTISPFAESDTEDPRKFMFSRATGADGNFAFRIGGTAPRFSIVAMAPGYSPGILEPAILNEENLIILAPSRAIRGRVRDFAGAPVEGAQIAWRGLLGATQCERRAVSSANGSYQIGDVPSVAAWYDATSAPFWFEVNAKDFAPLLIEDSNRENRRYYPANGAADEEFDIYLSRGARIRGRVVEDETGKPIPGALVALHSYLGMSEVGRGPNVNMQFPLNGIRVAETKTNETGDFSLDRVPSRGVHASIYANTMDREPFVGCVGAFVEGRAPAAADAPLLYQNESFTLELRLPRAGAVRGKVISGGGAPVAGMLVAPLHVQWSRFKLFFRSIPGAIVRSDENGFYTLPRVAAKSKESAKVSANEAAQEVAVHAFPDNFNLPFAYVNVQPKAGGTVDAPPLVIAADAEFDLEILDERGAAVPGAWATVFPSDSSWGYPSAVGDRAGHIHYALAGGHPFPGNGTLLIRAPGYAPRLTVKFTKNESGPNRFTDRVVLSKGRRLAGRAFHADGTPACDVQISVHNNGLARVQATAHEAVYTTPDGRAEPALYSLTRTRSDGSFAAFDLPPGPYFVHALWWSNRQSVESVSLDYADVSENEPPLEIQLPEKCNIRGSTVHGRVLDQKTSEPILSYWGTLDGGTGNFPIVRTGIGEFVVHHVPDGIYKLQIEARGCRSATIDNIQIGGPDGDRPIEARLVRGAVIRGTTRLPQGANPNTLWIDLAPASSATGGAWAYAHVQHDGSFVIEGVHPGKYYISADSAPVGDHRVSLSPAEAIPIEIGEKDTDREVHIVFVECALLQIDLECPLLPGQDLAGSEEQYKTRAGALLEFVASNGVAVATFEGLLSNQSFPHRVAPGHYRVRLTLPGRPADELDVDVPGTDTVRAKLVAR